MLFKVFWANIRVIELFLGWDQEPVQCVLFSRLDRVEDEHQSNDTGDVIVETSDILWDRCYLILDGEVQVSPINHLCKEVLQHAQEEHASARVFVNCVVPVLVHLLPRTIAVPEMLSEVLHEEECIINLLKAGWPTLRMTFGFMSCPLCKQEISVKGLSKPIAKVLGPLLA